LVLEPAAAEFAALYALTGAQHRAGDTFAAAATARRRVDLLHSVPVTPGTAFELIDCWWPTPWPATPPT
jgi:hypothetical protein